MEIDPNRLELEAKLLSVIGQPTRLKLLYMLEEGRRCACELTPEFDEDPSVISRHLSKMAEAGLLERTREGVQVHYGVTDPRVFRLLELTDDILRKAAKRRAEEALSAL